MGLGTCPVRFEGDEGWVETGDTGRIAVSLDSLRAKLPAPTITGTSTQTHVRDFFTCVKSRGRTAANADVMRRSHIACHAAIVRNEDVSIAVADLFYHQPQSVLR